MGYARDIGLKMEVWSTCVFVSAISLAEIAATPTRLVTQPTVSTTVCVTSMAAYARILSYNQETIVVMYTVSVSKTAVNQSPLPDMAVKSISTHLFYSWWGNHRQLLQEWRNMFKQWMPMPQGNRRRPLWIHQLWREFVGKLYLSTSVYQQIRNGDLIAIILLTTGVRQAIAT